MNNNEHVTQLEQFRQQVYQNFNKRADALMDLIDTLRGNTNARTVVELSLNPCFRRDYSSLFKAIDECQIESSRIPKLVKPHLPRPEQRAFWLFGVDVTPKERRFAPTLKDRGFVYKPNILKGNKPVTIGHQYSSVVCLPEKEAIPTWSALCGYASIALSTACRTRLKPRTVRDTRPGLGRLSCYLNQ